MNEGFRVVGRRPMPAPAPVKKAAPKGRAAMVFLLLLAAGCLIARFWTPKDPAYMDLVNANKAPCGEFLFGTDTMGRDIFSMIFYGGGISLTIGLVSTAISTVLPVVGGIISDAAETILAGASILRNTIGIFGLLAVAAMCIVPFLRMGIQYLLYKAAAGLAGTLADARLSGLVGAVGSALGMITGLVGASALMVFISVISVIKVVSG